MFVDCLFTQLCCILYATDIVVTMIAMMTNITTKRVDSFNDCLLIVIVYTHSVITCCILCVTDIVVTMIAMMMKRC